MEKENKETDNKETEKKETKKMQTEKKTRNDGSFTSPKFLSNFAAPLHC